MLARCDDDEHHVEPLLGAQDGQHGPARASPVQPVAGAAQCPLAGVGSRPVGRHARLRGLGAGASGSAGR